MHAAEIPGWFAARGVQVFLLRGHLVWVDIIPAPGALRCYGYASGRTEDAALGAAFMRYADEHPDLLEG